MISDTIKALWLALFVGVITGVAMSLQIEAPHLTDEQIEQWR
jgi:hypothetical protein